MMKEFKNSKDLGKMLADSMSSMGSFIVIVFFAAQLLAFLEWSNLGVIVAVKGAALLQGQNGIILILGIILLSVIINLLIGSASAKWGILAPIFIPMLMLVGFHPAFTQMLYHRNSISSRLHRCLPTTVIIICKKYDNNMKTNSLLSSHLLYIV